MSCLVEFGWEAWTRTRIARSRVWSPTNWTTSQQLQTLNLHHATAWSFGSKGSITAILNPISRANLALWRVGPDLDRLSRYLPRLCSNLRPALFRCPCDLRSTRSRQDALFRIRRSWPHPNLTAARDAQKPNSWRAFLRNYLSRVKASFANVCGPLSRILRHQDEERVRTLGRDFWPPPWQSSTAFF